VIKSQDLIYTCHAWGDPHLQTWRQHDTPLTSAQKQDCYANGEFALVHNQFLNYKVQTVGRYIIAASLEFFHPTTQQSVCNLLAIDFVVLQNPLQQCERNGVTWTVKGNILQYTVTISYSVNNVNFTTSIQRLSNRFDVHVWQPNSWAALSNGLCTQLDPKCSKSQTLPPETRTQSITYIQAYDTCQTYINAYLTRSQQKRSLLLKNTADSILGDCIEDVIYTGDITVAKDGLNVLMMEELTSGVTSISEIKKVIDAGIEQATLQVEEATKEATMRVARFF